MNTAPEHFRGLLVPALTPFAADLAPDPARFAAFCRWLLEEGADGLAVFGTTSEGNSLSVGERKALLEHIASRGIDPRRLMPGTGACAVSDAIDMTRHAIDLGVGGVLVLPPFYYKNQPDEGFFRYYAQIIERIGDASLKVYLYHFPQMSAAPISLSLIERLLKAYPGAIAGLKDSSGDWDGTKRLIAEFPDLAVFPSSESRLQEGLALGAAGCISATANIQPAAIAELIANHGTEAAEAAHERVSAVRTIVEKYPLIPALKAILAHHSGTPAWLRTRPPVTPLPEARRLQLTAELEASGALCPLTIEDDAA